MADVQRRLRSGTVVLGGMGLLAATLTACSSEPDKRCVDRDSYNRGKGYEVVADKYCKSSTSTHHVGWYYGGDKKSSRVKGGSFVKPGGSGGSGGSGGGVHRGGFGGGKGGSGG
ncbi:hypothetical protein [Streptomyces sp. NPDC127066]|uniref:hypothetical protein n=1 Tax=Streptomyces sp. NPDC127066 TaxID=3347125 RepID=UPI0036476942